MGLFCLYIGMYKLKNFTLLFSYTSSATKHNAKVEKEDMNDLPDWDCCHEDELRWENWPVCRASHPAEFAPSWSPSPSPPQTLTPPISSPHFYCRHFSRLGWNLRFWISVPPLFFFFFFNLFNYQISKYENAPPVRSSFLLLQVHSLLSYPQIKEHVLFCPNKRNKIWWTKNKYYINYQK